ncbi:MAG TPA: hypothetical protein VL099_12035 [Candidatus Binatia bacterium]|nr:hypothetical protein [Candidatus Binatia bacterium]
MMQLIYMGFSTLRSGIVVSLLLFFFRRAGARNPEAISGAPEAQQD